VNPERLRGLLRRLLDIYSPSGKEEEITEFLLGYLAGEGLPVTIQRVDDNRRNLLVIPPETELQAVLIGHIDTVAAHDLNRYGYEEQRGDRVAGLGAADMKGGCAAMIEAYAALWASGNRRLPAALALVVGEEETGDGAGKLAEEFHFPWALIGEPTGLRPCLSHYGYVEVQVVTHGRRMHASLARIDRNPIQSMLRLLLKISHYIENERPEIVYNIRDLASSESGFAVPDRCDAWLDFHLPPTAGAGEIVAEIEAVFAGEQAENPDLNGALRFTIVHAGYELPEEGPLIETLREVYGRHRLPWNPGAFPSHSDANLLRASGMKPILAGAGELEQAHAPGESVSMQQVALAARVYHDLLLSL
jgi:acetylornithine deacetylase